MAIAGQAGLLAQIELAAHGGDPFAQPPSVQVIDAAKELEVFFDGQRAVQRKLLGYIADVGAGLSRAVRRSLPATRSRPLVAGSSPHSIRKVVVLPAPLGPSRPKISPRWTQNEVLSTAVNAPEALDQITHFNHDVIRRTSVSAAGRADPAAGLRCAGSDCRDALH